MTTIQVRIDEKTKSSAKRVLDELGLDMSSAIKAYLKQIAIQKRIPMPLVTKNGLTPQEERKINQAAAEVKKRKNVSRWFESVDEMFDELDAEKKCNFGFTKSSKNNSVSSHQKSRKKLKS